MSLGWLTESSLLPKKSKPIVIKETASQLGFEAVLASQKQRLQHEPARKTFKIDRRPPVQNPGIQQRIQKDAAKMAEGIKIRESGKVLEKKQRIYGDLEGKKRNVNSLLVDFAAKTQLIEDEGYQKAKEQFYAGKLEELQRQRQQIQTEGQGQRDQRQRLAWEREVLGELKGQVEEREKVQQVFDRRLRGQQREALDQVLKEREQQEKRLEQIRKRREQLQEQRIRKLKKLQIISDSKALTDLQEERFGKK